MVDSFNPKIQKATWSRVCSMTSQEDTEKPRPNAKQKPQQNFSFIENSSETVVKFPCSLGWPGTCHVWGVGSMEVLVLTDRQTRIGKHIALFLQRKGVYCYPPRRRGTDLFDSLVIHALSV